MAEKIKPLDIIKKNMKTDKMLFGTDNTLKALKLAKLSHVFISANAPVDVVDDLEYYGKCHPKAFPLPPVFPLLSYL